MKQTHVFGWIIVLAIMLAGVSSAYAQDSFSAATFSSTQEINAGGKTRLLRSPGGFQKRDRGRNQKSLCWQMVFFQNRQSVHMIHILVSGLISKFRMFLINF